VDVAAYANLAGAYTTLDPLRVTIASLDSRNQDAEALEVSLSRSLPRHRRAGAGRHYSRMPPA